MKNYVVAFILGVAAWAAPALGQSGPFLLPPAVEKDLAARASDVTEVTLDKNMLAFAAKFMTGKDKDDAATQQLIQGLDGIYVRDYEFDKEGQYSMDQIAQKLRRSPMASLCLSSRTNAELVAPVWVRLVAAAAVLVIGAAFSPFVAG